MTINSIGRNINFNNDWKFSRSNDLMAPFQVYYDDSNWESLNLPHDWSIFFDFNPQSLGQNEAGLLDGGYAWYRKHFKLSKSLKGKRIKIHFEGIYMDSQIFVNGHFVGSYPNGYVPFTFDLTDYLEYEDNLIAILVKNQQPSSRWYSGSGIYRDVHLSVLDPLHILDYGLKINPRIEGKYGLVGVDIKMSQSHRKLTYQVLLKKGREVIEEIVHKKSNFEIKVKKPIRWDIYQGERYNFEIFVYEGNRQVDYCQEFFGFREIVWLSDIGLWLNGRNLKLQGVCLHHDHGALGSKSYYEVNERQIDILVDMGVNAIRSTHNLADRHLIELCDKRGLLLIDESFDTWYEGKKQYDMGRFFNEKSTYSKNKTWAQEDLEIMIHRGYNHPSIFMYSVGNEISESNVGDLKAKETIKKLVSWAKAIDERRFVTMGQDVYRWASTGPHELISEELDLVGLNYAEDSFSEIRKTHPNWKLYGSETSSATRSRGVYAYPDQERIHDNLRNRNFQQSDYGSDRVSWGKTASQSLIFDRNHQAYGGQFVWTGFDYIGEPTPWHNQNDTPVKSSYFGIVDSCGFKKNDYYLYQSQWSQKAMVHLFPHWNWQEIPKLMETEDGLIPLRVYSNCASVELYLNGQSLGKKSFLQKKTDYGKVYQEGANPDQLYLEWRVAFQAGELLAQAMNEKGEVLVSDSVKTADLASQLHVEIKQYNRFLFLEVNALDARGNKNPLANNLLAMTLKGQAEIVGVDNGNSATFERYQANDKGEWKRSLFNGKMLIIVKQQGSFSLKISSPNLKDYQFAWHPSKESSKKHLKDVVKIRLEKIKGSTLTLPAKIRGSKGLYYSVKWNQKSGEEKFVQGFLEDGRKVLAEIDEIELEIIEPKTSCAVKGDVLKLPDTLELKHPNGYREFSPIEYDASGLGHVRKYNIQIQPNIKYYENYKFGKSISQMWTGSTLPLVFSNRELETYVLNDGQSNKEFHFKKDDHLGVLFGDSGVIAKKFIKNISLKGDFDKGEIRIYTYVKDEIKEKDVMKPKLGYSNQKLWKEIKNFATENKDGWTNYIFEGLQTFSIQVVFEDDFNISQVEVYEVLGIS